jgi:hypothetical protein
VIQSRRRRNERPMIGEGDDRHVTVFGGGGLKERDYVEDLGADAR